MTHTPDARHTHGACGTTVSVATHTLDPLAGSKITAAPKRPVTAGQFAPDTRVQLRMPQTFGLASESPGASVVSDRPGYYPSRACENPN